MADNHPLRLMFDLGKTRTNRTALVRTADDQTRNSVPLLVLQDEPIE